MQSSLPTDHAWNIRVGQEIARARKKFVGVVYLDCHKCYERVPRLKAAHSAQISGCPGQIVNLVFALYAGTRHLSVHGAISQTCGGHTGLIAGCGFAVRFLRAFLPCPAMPRGVSVRAYVDEFAVTAQSGTAWGGLLLFLARPCLSFGLT